MSASIFVGHGIGWVWWRLAVALPLAAWLAFAVWALSYLNASRQALAAHGPLALASGTGAEIFSKDTVRVQIATWAGALELAEQLTAVLLGLALWAAILLVMRRPHPRQWGTILAFAAIALVAWLFFRAGNAPGAAVERWISPSVIQAVQWAIAGAAVGLIALAIGVLRRAPEPVDPRYDRHTLGGAYTPFNKVPPGMPGEALSEARARAESVLPVEDDADSS